MAIDLKGVDLSVERGKYTTIRSISFRGPQLVTLDRVAEHLEVSRSRLLSVIVDEWLEYRRNGKETGSKKEGT